MRLIFERDLKYLHPDVIAGKRKPTLKERFQKQFVFYTGKFEVAKERNCLVIEIPIDMANVPDEFVRVSGQIEMTFDPDQYAPLRNMLERLTIRR